MAAPTTQELPMERSCVFVPGENFVAPFREITIDELAADKQYKKACPRKFAEFMRELRHPCPDAAYGRQTVIMAQMHRGLWRMATLLGNDVLKTLRRDCLTYSNPQSHFSITLSSDYGRVSRHERYDLDVRQLAQPGTYPATAVPGELELRVSPFVYGAPKAQLKRGVDELYDRFTDSSRGIVDSILLETC